MSVATCPDCDEEIELHDPEVGDELDCDACGAGLSVVQLDPLELDLADDDDPDPVDEEF